jgi:phosphate transport system substrate-binding protein
MTKRCGFLAVLAGSLMLVGACKKDEGGGSDPKTTETAGGQTAGGEQASGGKVSGDSIQMDGSSTVFPISQAVAEEFQKAKGGRVTVGVSGTGGGFKKFCRGEIAIAGASRPIKDEEQTACKAAGIDFIELPVAYDGLAVIVHPQNDWVDKVTVAELKTIWAPEAQGKIMKWSQVRKGWPDKDLHLFGPGVDSGTYDYFTQAVVGKEHASRGDFTSSEDDNVLVQGVSSDTSALGFFGYAYYSENKDKLKLVPVDDEKDENGKGPIEATPETVENGTYQPLSRPIFIYVSTKHMSRPEVKSFVEYYLNEGPALVKEVGYIPLPAKAYELVRKRFADSKTGSVFHGSKVGVTVEELLSGGA